MGVMLILPDVRDHEYAKQRALDTWDCVSSGEALRLIHDDKDGEIRAVYGHAADVGRVIDALDNPSKSRIRLIVVRSDPKADPPWHFNGPWELVYRA